MGNGNITRIHKNKNYTTISNTHLKEKEMSLKAKGLLTVMLSLPDNWEFSIEGLAGLNKDSRDSIKSALEELTQFGYFYRELKNKGKFTSIYHIYENPTTEHDLTQNNEPERIYRDGFSVTENPRQLNTKDNIINISNKEVNTISNDNKVTNIKELRKNKVNKQLNLKDKIDRYTNNIEIRTALYSYLEMYKEKFKSYPTHVAFDTMLVDIRTYSQSTASIALQIIERSTKREYKEFYPIEDKTNNNGCTLKGPTYIHKEQKKADPKNIVDIEY
jgi:hypothetical protein